jgi:carbonic anhydrase
MTDKSYTPTNKPSDALVIHCVDHRFQQAFNKFIGDELKIAVFNPIVIAGGALAVSSDHFAKFGYIWDQVDLFVKEKGVNRIILINHEDCAWYKYENPGLKPDELKELGRSDLSRAAANNQID